MLAQDNSLAGEAFLMAANDSAFAGSIPQLYDHYLGPFLFEPYADEVARRAAALRPKRILETAAGTGIVTEALHRACPDAEIVATDLNQAMLDVAATRIHSERVVFVASDAQALPFDADGFDLVVCQFGVMFYPDRIKGNAEARRILQPGGRYMLVIWDGLDRNPASARVHQAVASLFPDSPPQFLARTPFGYNDPARIEHDLLEAGFTDIGFETVALKSRPEATPKHAAFGLVCGSPLKAEIEEREPGAAERVAEAAERAFDAAGFDSSLSAHVVTAIK
jgi:ubiquinone/menaquinone biosynthesis C-methylase UbiE